MTAAALVFLEQLQQQQLLPYWCSAGQVANI